MLKRISAAICILLGACEYGEAREVVYGYYTPSDPKPPPIHYPLFPPEIWRLILQDLPIRDLASAAKTCKGLEKATQRIDRSYIPKIAHQSGNLKFFITYMTRPILGLTPSFSPLEDLYTIFGSYKELYTSGYMKAVFAPEHIKAHDAVVQKLETMHLPSQWHGDISNDQEQVKTKHITESILKALQTTTIFPFQYKKLGSHLGSTVKLCNKYRGKYHFQASFYYPLSSSQALWESAVYIYENPKLVLLLSRMPVKPQLRLLSIRYIPITQPPVWLSQMTTLINLRLGGAGLCELPTELTTLKNLQSLDLDHNKFTQIPPIIGRLTQLQFLSLKWNLLTDLSRDIEYLKVITDLKDLWLSENYISHIDFLIYLSHLKNLEDVLLTNNKVRFIPTWVTSLRKLTDQHLTIHLQENSFQSLIGSFLKNFVPGDFHPRPQERPDYNSNPQVKVITD